MNIAFVNSTERWGGVKTWLLDFAEGLVLRGHTIRVYGRQSVFIEAAVRRTGHGEVVSFGPDLNPFSIGRFYRAFTENAIDVVFTNIGKDLATAGVAARLLSIPVVQQIGLPHDIPHRLKTRLLHRWIKPRFLCSCKYIEEGFLQSLPYLDPADSHVVLTAKRTSTHSLKAHTPRRIVVTQQLYPDKGHETLLRALAPLDIPYELHVAGTGSLDVSLRTLAFELGMGDKVIWHGFVNDVNALLQEGDVFLLGSLAEGLPNTLQEAMAQGLLPVIRNVGGVLEVIPPELTPWVLPYEATAEDFSSCIEAALRLSDDDLLRLRASARTACTTFFDLDAKTAELEAWLMGLGGLGEGGRTK